MLKSRTLERCCNRSMMKRKLQLQCESPIHFSGCMDVDNETSQHDKRPKSCERARSRISLQEILPALSLAAKGRPDDQSGQSAESANLEEEVRHNQTSDSVLASSKPDFSRLKGDLDLENFRKLFWQLLVEKLLLRISSGLRGELLWD
ncbi:hypothetical protein Droror1_Dr00003096 [Drosera rotundifolia]